MSREPAILVFGYHEVGYECISALIARNEKIVAVFTHEDSSSEEIWFQSVAALANRHAIPVFTPGSVNQADWIARIRAFKPDLIFSFYYRNMLSNEILESARLGSFNMHGSLLPKYRGRAPINWAVLHGETQTGATLHHMVARADAGDIVDQEKIALGPQDTAHAVFAKVTRAARLVLERNIDLLKRGVAPRYRQDESRATYFGGRRPEDGRIDWRRGAGEIFNLIRAVTHPYPGAFTEIQGKRLFIWWALPLPEGGGVPGEVLSTAPLRIAAGEGSLEVLKLQWQGQAAAAGNNSNLASGQICDNTVGGRS
jgi:methionyl-tRNA formyltransferase